MKINSLGKCWNKCFTKRRAREYESRPDSRYLFGMQLNTHGYEKEAYYFFGGGTGIA